MKVLVLMTMRPAVLSLTCLTGSFSAWARPVLTGQRCGADPNEPPARVIANSEGKGWQQYPDVKSVPELQLNAGAAVMQWPGSHGKLLVAIQELAEDFSVYAYYCFDKAGYLTQIRYELGTAWRWGCREEGSVVKKKFNRETSIFFSTETEQPIPRPEQADDVPDALKPTFYLKKSQLPFFQLLPK